MNEANTPEVTADVIDAAFESNDPEVRKLPLNSPDLNAALEESKTDSDEGDDDAPAGDDTDEQETAGKKKPRARDRRIDQLTAKIGELQRSLEQREAKAPEAKAPEPDFKPSIEKPKIQDFNSLETYTEAMTEWKLEVREQERAHTAKIRELEKQSAAVRESWQTREQDVVKDYPDYSEVVTVESLKTASPSNEARLYLGECEDGPRVLYNLLSDAEQAEKFASASPVKQVAMLAKLEAQLGSGSEVKKNIASKAPEPPRNLPSGNTASVARNILTKAHEMSFEDFDRQMSQYERNKKRR